MTNSSSMLHLFFVILLLTHGAAYFITGDIYDKENPVKLVKYIISILYFFSLFFYLHRMKDSLFFIRTLLFWLCLFSVLMFFAFINSLQIDYVVFLLLPFLYVFIYSTTLDSKIVSAYQWILILALVFMFLEFLFFFDISSRFNRSGFRAISIFVNPNAFGATVVLLFITVMFHVKNSFSKVFNTFICLAMVLLSGSKTALAAILLMIFFFSVKHIGRNLFFYFTILLLNLCFLSFFAGTDISPNFSFDLQVRTLDLASGTERLKALSEFAQAANDCLFLPINCNELIYVDNAFVSSWVSLGLPGLIITSTCFLTSVVFSFYLAFNLKNYYFFCFFIMFWLMAMSTNLMNIWPTAYIFWITYGYMLNLMPRRSVNA